MCNMREVLKKVSSYVMLVAASTIYHYIMVNFPIYISLHFL